MKDRYEKLVRDLIPEIIIRQGDNPITKILNDEEYFNALNAKLNEEVAEYSDGYDIEELADIIEVIYAILDYKGISKDEFERLRAKKYNERGGFLEKICLLEVERN